MTLDEAADLITTELDAVEVSEMVMESTQLYTPPEEPYRYLTGEDRD